MAALRCVARWPFPDIFHYLCRVNQFSNSMHISKNIFWDVDFNQLDMDQNSSFIINRVVARGTLDDWFSIKTYYGLQLIKDIIINSRYLDKISLSFFSLYFDLPKEQFRCYNIQQSTQQLWNF